MNASKGTPIRVLTRPQSSPTLNSPQSRVNMIPPTPPESKRIGLRPSFPDKVVVVGFIGERSDHVTELMNRILDANVFGSGKMDRSLVDGDGGEVSEELKRWFKLHRVRYFHEVEKGTLFLEFASVELLELVDEVGEFETGVEDWEVGNLQGMLLMFSVCHVLVYVQDGSRFNTQVLKKLRILQAEKQALSTFMRSQSASYGVGDPNVESFSHPTVSISSFKNPSPGKNGGGMRRNASSFSGVSGLGSSTSMFPGSCTPVTLFVFLDDFSSIVSFSSTSEVTTDKSYLLPGNMMSRQGLSVKGGGSVVVLARPAPAPATKLEQTPRKKLQSSLESQIRLLVKKSKLQIGSERSRPGLRSGGALPTSVPLLSLDASKAVILVDKLSNQKGKSLDFACGIVDDILKGNATSDTLLLENHAQMVDKDDLKSLKEFIMRQSDIFRGRGGPLSTGVGMIAAAVAAATASSSSGKSVAVPELPALKVWLSITQFILHGLVSNRLVFQKPISSEVNDQRNVEEADRVVSLLESGTGLNAKFSNLWCQRVLPAAKDIYLKDLPPCYTTGRHETHLQKALTVFHSMVKGPAVQRFSKQLEEDCTLIWKNGRQQCDAVSLTGKPCVHQRHDMSPDISASNAIVSSHSSGFAFLHACACGRSRFVRPDPFDFETASSSSSCPSECGKLPHGCQFPQLSYGGNGKSAAWSLIRIGAASYYDPTKGLLQSGFCDSQKFLLSWIIFLQKPNFSKVAPVVAGSTVDLKVIDAPDVEPMKDDVVKLYQRDTPHGVVNKRRSSVSDNVNGNTISFVRELPNSTIRKPFAEVVAGSAASDVDFPPLKHSTLVSPGTDKGIKHEDFANGTTVKVYLAAASKDPRMRLDSVEQKGNASSLMNDKDNWPQLQSGNSSMSGNLNGSENSWLKQVVVYVGFEYECPYGHRFILSSEHLLELGLLNPAPEESLLSDSTRKSNNRFSDAENGLKSGSPRKIHQRIYENNVTMNRGRRNGKSKEKIPFKLRERISTGERPLDASSGHGNHHLHRGLPPHIKSANNVVESPKSVSLDSIGSASSLLNTNLPVYINCRHCQNSKHKEDAQNVKFASTISQLQRIFMVTPPLPIVLATCPLVQYETSLLPPSFLNREEKVQFSPASDVILPPESFIVLRLPFIYGTQMEDGSLHPLTPSVDQPELTAWLVKGTALRVVSGGCFHSG